MESVENSKNVADAAYVQGRYIEAVENYNFAIEIIKDDQEIDVCLRSALHSNRCMCYIKLDKLMEALKDAQTALALRPRWAKAHLRCAQCHELQGALEEAIIYYQRAAELDTTLAGEVMEPMKTLQTKLAQQHCHAIMLPPPPLSSYSTENNNNTSQKLAPIYYASLCPHPIKIESKCTNILAAAYGDGAIRLWCTTTGILIQTLQEAHSQAATTLAWNSDGTMLASGSLDTTCAIWGSEKLTGDAKKEVVNGGGEILNFKLVSILKGHSGRVSAVKFADFEHFENIKANSEIVITASTDLSIKVWKINSTSLNDEEDKSTGGCLDVPPAPHSPFSECLYTLEGHSSLVSDIDIDPIYSKILVSASGDAQFKLWDLENNGHLVENVAWESGPVVLCGFLPSPLPLLLTAHAQLARQEGRILLWDVLEKKDGWVDGHLVAPSWSLDGFVGRPTSWDACCTSSSCGGDNGNAGSSGSDSEEAMYSSEYSTFSSVEKVGKKEEEGSILLAVACSDATVRVWELLYKNTRPLELFSFEIPNYSAHSGSNPSKNELPPWHAAALAQQQTPRNAFKVKFSPRGRILAVTGGDANQVIFIWSIQLGEHVCTFAGHSARIRSLEWSQDGMYLYSASEDGAVRKWQIKQI